MIGYGRQHITDEDLAAVAAVLRSDFLTCGPAVDAFEAEIRRITGAAHAVAVSNGTSALRLLYQAVGVGPGKRVGVPAITFVATASQAMLLGAEVVLLDVDPATLCLTPEILDRCRERLDYVVPVHFAGRLCDLQGIAEVAARKGITVLEDGAHSFGSTWLGSAAGGTDGHRCGDGTWSKGCTLSFHPVKNITTGEGGAICVNDPAVAKRLRSARHHGIMREGWHGDLVASESAGSWYHEFHVPSTNERMSDINCALGTSQCQRMESFKSARAAQIERYRQELPAWCGVPVAAVGQAPFWHLCALQVDWSATRYTRAEAVAAARGAGIAFMVHYLPLHHHPILATAVRGSDLAGADRAYPGLLSIPCYPGLSATDQGTVIAWLRSIQR